MEVSSPPLLIPFKLFVPPWILMWHWAYRFCAVHPCIQRAPWRSQLLQGWPGWKKGSRWTQSQWQWSRESRFPEHDSRRLLLCTWKRKWGDGTKLLGNFKFISIKKKFKKYWKAPPLGQWPTSGFLGTFLESWCKKQAGSLGVPPSGNQLPGRPEVYIFIWV